MISCTNQLKNYKENVRKLQVMPTGGGMMCQFSGILRSTLTENNSIRFAIVENLYENLFLTANTKSCGINFSQNRAPGVVITSAKFDIKILIDPNSCRSRQDESNHHINMRFHNY